MSPEEKAAKLEAHKAYVREYQRTHKDRQKELRKLRRDRYAVVGGEYLNESLTVGTGENTTWRNVEHRQGKKVGVAPVLDDGVRDRPLQRPRRIHINDDTVFEDPHSAATHAIHLWHEGRLDEEHIKVIQTKAGWVVDKTHLRRELDDDAEKK
jgi:hypothetical protein